MTAIETRVHTTYSRRREIPTDSDIMLSLLREKGVLLPRGAYVGPQPFLVRYISTPPYKRGEHTILGFLQVTPVPNVTYDLWPKVVVNMTNHPQKVREAAFYNTTLEQISAGIHDVLAVDERVGERFAGMSFGFQHVDQREDGAGALYDYLNVPRGGPDGGLLYLWVAEPIAYVPKQVATAAELA